MQQQLAGFRQEMERDSRAQRTEARKLVSAAIKRAQKLVDSTLQVVCLSQEMAKNRGQSCQWRCRDLHLAATKATSFV